MSEVLYGLTVNSANKKLGGSFTSMKSSANSCPDTCPFQGSGCYGENFPMSLHWGKGCNLPLDKLTWHLGKIPTGRNIRFHEVGDYTEGMQEVKVFSGVVGRRKFNVLSYTHRLPTEFHMGVAKSANYVINFSGESAAHAEWCLDNGVNAVIALPSVFEGKYIKYGTVNVVVCPAVYRDTTCGDCMLCAKDRVKCRIVIGFPAHGAKKKEVDRVLGSVA